MNDLEKLLGYVQVSKQLAAVKAHSGLPGDDRYYIGMAYAYQDIENMLISKLRSLDNERNTGQTDS